MQLVPRAKQLLLLLLEPVETQQQVQQQQQPSQVTQTLLQSPLSSCSRCWGRC